MNQAAKYKINSIQYVNETSSYTMYILGFQTAYNLQTDDTYDIFGNFESSQLLSWVEKYCKDNPLDTFGIGVVSLSIEAYPRRKKAQ